MKRTSDIERWGHAWMMIAAWTLLTVSLLVRCAEDNPLRNADGVLGIDSIIPSSGTTGTPVRVYGRGFSLNPEDNILTLNGTLLAVQSPGSLRTLLTIIPEGASTGPVTIRVGDTESEGPVFTLLQPPVILEVTPLRGYAGERVFITGSNLDEVTAVYFNGSEAEIISSKPEELVVIVPSSSNGPITLTFPHGTVTGPEYTYLPIPLIITAYANRSFTGLYVAGYYFAVDPTRVQVYFNSRSIPVLAGGIVEEIPTLYVEDHPKGNEENPTLLRVVSDGISSLPYRYIVTPYITTYSLQHSDNAEKIYIRLNGSYFGSASENKIVRITRVETQQNVSFRLVTWASTEILLEVDNTPGYYYDIYVDIEGRKSEPIRLRY